MIDQIEITINNEKYKYSKGITLQEIYMEHQGDLKHPVILARVNNRLRELSTKIYEDVSIEFLDLSSPEGNRAHINGLIMVMLCAIRKLYGRGANINVQQSIDKGIYIETGFRLTENKLKDIKETMKDIIKKDMPITKLTIDRLEAIKYYNDIGDITKAKVMKYNTDNYVTLYRLGNVYDYFYNLMPPSSGTVKEFDLTYIKENGLVLRFPTVYISDKIKKYEHHPLMFDVFQEFKEWAKIIGISNSVELNETVSTGKISDIIKIDETLQSNRLLNIAKEINKRRDKVKVVLMAGPSSSGKTTTSRKLCMYLESFGLHPKAIGMDDYFLDRADTPKDEFGNYDYENITAIDLKLLDTQIRQLFKGEKVLLPKYNFKYGIKEFRDEMQLGENDIIVLEGIHALDSSLINNENKDYVYRIYISPLTQLSMDDHNRIPTSDNRLLRRIVRDNRTRNYSVEHTLEQWKNVRSGEEKYIFPYQDNCDVIINSASIYEIGVLKTYVEPLLYSVNNDSPYYEEAKRLINFLRLFLPIPADSIPEDAVIREFIGGSYFHE